ncbi:MAG: Hsp70 family protein, partial [Thermoguttaceae bacterium]|nr:Hsp70 family protein [Thermoguttaceae bacterium]
TFDVSILNVAEGVCQVISTHGDGHLGGDDFDNALVTYVADNFQRANGIDLRKDPMALQRLQEACEKAKKELSSAATTSINLPFITADATGPKHLMENITRAQFEQLVSTLVERCRGPVNQCLQDAHMSASEIDEVVLVGGSTRIPMVQELVKKIFGKEPHKGVNPDEVVAIGAAIQGGVLSGEVNDILLLDVTPLTLGIETLGGVMTPLVERNTTIPTTKKQVFSTAENNQSAVTVRVFQGERPMANDNRLLGQFNLDNIPPAPRGVPQIEVCFDIDSNGILNVSAKDLGTNRETSVRIEKSSGLSDEEIKKMQREAEAHAEEDKKRRELAEERNKAESMCWNLEKMMQDNASVVTEADKAAIEPAIEKAREAAKGEDLEAIKSAVSALEQASHAFATQLYQKAQAAQGAAGAQAGPQGPFGGEAPNQGPKQDDDTIDADFEVK